MSKRYEVREIKLTEQEKTTILKLIEKELQGKGSNKFIWLLGLIAGNIGQNATTEDRLNLINETEELSRQINRPDCHAIHIGPIERWNDFPEALTAARQNFRNQKLTERFDFFIAGVG